MLKQAPTRTAEYATKRHWYPLWKRFALQHELADAMTHPKHARIEGQRADLSSENVSHEAKHYRHVHLLIQIYTGLIQ